MSDESTKLEWGHHSVQDNGHTHAREAIERMSPLLKRQLYEASRDNSEHGGVFSVHKDGRDVEYKISSEGHIHEHHR